MSQAVEPDANSPTNYDVDVDLLLRNARKVDVATERESETESWTRGREGAGDAIVEDRGPLGVRVVKLPDGQPHGTLLVEAAGDEKGPFAGACDCDGFLKGKKGACAHMVTRAVRSALQEDEVPVDTERFRQLTADRGQDQPDVDDDVQEAEENDDDAALSDVGGLEEVDQDDQEDVVDVPAQVVDEAPATIDGDPFAAELRENIPERYVMRLGGEPYIRRAGYAAIARQADLRISLEAKVPAEETDFQHARYEATVRDKDGDILVEGETGTAHLAIEDLANAEAQLDELASTRAFRRAVEIATGAGATLRRDGR